MTDAAPGQIRIASRQGKLILLGTILGTAVVFIDSTVVNVALPAIQEDLGGGVSGLQWTIDAYLLSLSALILVGGTFAFKQYRTARIAAANKELVKACLLYTSTPTARRRCPPASRR